MYLPKKLFLFIGFSLTLAACNDSNDDSSNENHSNSATSTTTLTTTVKFAAWVNDQPLQCGKTYSGVGLGKGFREIVHDASLRHPTELHRWSSTHSHAGASLPLS